MSEEQRGHFGDRLPQEYELLYEEGMDSFQEGLSVFVANGWTALPESFKALVIQPRFEGREAKVAFCILLARPKVVRPYER